MIFDQNMKQRIQDKFAHYLKSYRRRKDLTQSDLAKILGYAESHIRKFEGRQADNRMTHALEFLHNIASLEGLDLVSFFAYLEGRSADDGTQRQLYPWEQTVLNRLQITDLAVRRQFIVGFLEKEKSPERLSKVLFLAARIGHLSSEDLSLVDSLIHRLGQKNFIEEEP